MQTLIKILVIEDELTVRESLNDLLSAAGYTVFTAADGAEGIKLAAEIVPDLIICDIMMPEADGFEVLEKIRKDADLNSAPFIFLTAKAEMTDLRNGMNLGADDYVIKPFKASALLKAVSIRLEKFKAMRENRAHMQTRSPRNDCDVLTEEDKLFIKVEGLPKIIKIGEIICIKAETDYTYVYLLNGGKILVRKLLKQWECQLPPTLFLRIHRSSIINLNMIEKIERWPSRSYIVTLKYFEEKFIVSQRYASKLRGRINK